MTRFKKDPFDYSRRIVRGAEFMDAIKPGWDLDVNERKLDLADASVCVLGQAFDRHYREGRVVLRASLPWYRKLFQTSHFVSRRYGFTIPIRHSGEHTYRYAYSRLTEQWLDFVHERRNLTNAVSQETAQQKQAGALK
jgi:hypothetical protein